MRTYKVKYVIQTKSRYGAYNYECSDTFEAENEDAAKAMCKEYAPTQTSFKRFKVIIRNIEKI